MEILLAPLILGVLVGLVMGLTGAGGAVLAVPLLIFALKLPIAQAAIISLLGVFASSAILAIAGLRQNLVRYKAAMLIAAFGYATVPLGTSLARQLSTDWLKFCYVLVLLYVAWLTWRSIKQQAPQPSCKINLENNKFNWTAPCAARLSLTGALTGLLSGLLGVGAGFVVNPALRRFSDVDTQTALHTTFAAVALITAASLALRGINHIPSLSAPFVLGMLTGAWAGRVIFADIADTTRKHVFIGLALTSVSMVLV